MKKRKSPLVSVGVVGLLIASGVFFGIDIASSGIHRVHGDYENGVQVPAPSAARQDEPAAASAEKSEPALADGTAQANVPTAENITFINRLAIKLGEALQWGAKQAIRLTVSLFDGLI